RLADALHQAGRVPEAQAAFRLAETVQAKSQPSAPYLLGFPGFWYCDLLLGQKQLEHVVQQRASAALEHAKTNLKSFLEIGVHHLSLGQASQLDALKGNSSAWLQAEQQLDWAVETLRKSAFQGYLMRALLAYAAYCRTVGNPQRGVTEM